MELDFTGLNGAGKKQAPELAQNQFFEQGEYRNTSGQENPAGGQETRQNGNQLLQQESDKRKKSLDTAAEVYRRYQENIKATELLQAEILKGIRAQEDIYSLFLKAAKALSFTLDCPLFYEQIKRELPEYYNLRESSGT